MLDLFGVDGKLVLITGGAQGLGRMIAEGFVQAGAEVVITSRKRDVGEAAAQALSANGRCVALQANLATAEGAVELAARFSASHDRLDVLVNNAGKTWGAPIEAFPDSAWTDVMTVNVQSPFTLVRELLPLLKVSASRDGPARIINIGSLTAIVAEKLQAYSYAASKAAIHHLTRVLASDLAQHNITANVIAPGYFPTRMTTHIRADEQLSEELAHHIPLIRMGRPDDIAASCIFLASAAGSYLTGVELPVDGGISGCR
jgi:NAD(P)-dependent dehydrogenase (short-subunit alcohol dehydrogenase family)